MSTVEFAARAIARVDVYDPETCRGWMPRYGDTEALPAHRPRLIRRHEVEPDKHEIVVERVERLALMYQPFLVPRRCGRIRNYVVIAPDGRRFGSIHEAACEVGMCYNTLKNWLAAESHGWRKEQA